MHCFKKQDSIVYEDVEMELCKEAKVENRKHAPKTNHRKSFNENY